MNNLKQVSMVIDQYVNDYNGFYPISDTFAWDSGHVHRAGWQGKIAPYVYDFTDWSPSANLSQLQIIFRQLDAGSQVFICPEAKIRKRYSDGNWNVATAYAGFREFFGFGSSPTAFPSNKGAR